MKIKAYAKINLFLSVVGRRPDGYHDIESIMQTVSLADTLTVDTYITDTREITLTVSDPSLPCDERNLAHRAASAFLDAYARPLGVRIHIEKIIPAAAGLAGGSADCAAVLRALNLLCGCPFTTDELCRIGAALGADVPFCVRGGTMTARGIGEVLDECPPLSDCVLLIVRPHEAVSTADAYRKIDALPPHAIPPVENMISALEAGTLDVVSNATYNIFEEVITETSEVFHVKDALVRSGAELSMMSGSGPAVFGIFSSEDNAKTAREALSRMGYESHLARPVGIYEDFTPTFTV